MNILIASTRYNPSNISKGEGYTLTFSNKNNIEKNLNDAKHSFEIIIIDASYFENMSDLVNKLNINETTTIFICGEVTDKESLHQHNKNIFFLPDNLETVLLEKAIQLTKLNGSNLLLSEENKTLKDQIEKQTIMITELEQTNFNLISATWRERDMKKQLKEAMDEIEKSKNIIEIQNKRISESINYARKIQLAINPTDEDIKTYLPESFVLYKPKDVISGDFPWFSKKGDSIYIAAVDCTGHGVPGAMMSMIGNLLLNDIVNHTENPDPGKILDNLHQSIVTTLKQKTSGINSADGMDIALIQLNQSKNELHFSSAHRPLFLIRNNELIEFKGDRFPIGGIQYDKKRVPYSNISVAYQPGDIVLIFSDGLPDQIGGEERKKFMSGKIAEIALKNCNLKMKELEKIYDQSITNWMEGNKQLDDILLIGIKF